MKSYDRSVSKKVPTGTICCSWRFYCDNLYNSTPCAHTPCAALAYCVCYIIQAIRGSYHTGGKMAHSVLLEREMKMAVPGE